jgi:hypothetical protein
VPRPIIPVVLAVLAASGLSAREPHPAQPSRLARYPILGGRLAWGMETARIEEALQVTLSAPSGFRYRTRFRAGAEEVEAILVVTGRGLEAAVLTTTMARGAFTELMTRLAEVYGPPTRFDPDLWSAGDGLPDPGVMAGRGHPDPVRGAYRGPVHDLLAAVRHARPCGHPRSGAGRGHLRPPLTGRPPGASGPGGRTGPCPVRRPRTRAGSGQGPCRLAVRQQRPFHQSAEPISINQPNSMPSISRYPGVQPC